jgi:hypothetical protein
MHKTKILVLAVLAIVATRSISAQEPQQAYQSAGSSLLFPMWKQGSLPTGTREGPVPRTSFEIRIACPKQARCLPKEKVRMAVNWVCPVGNTNPEFRRRADFIIKAAVNSTVRFNSENLKEEKSIKVLPPKTACSEGHVVVWMVDQSGRAIKYDGLSGRELVRDRLNEATPVDAMSMRARRKLPTGALLDANLRRDNSRKPAHKK